MTPAFARTSDPMTSTQAADAVPVTALEARCLRIIQVAVTGLTSEELAAASQLSLVTVSPRLRPLAEKGLIVAQGTRRNRSGRQAIVWVATPTHGRLF